jgi:hypothetical protein
VALFEVTTKNRDAMADMLRRRLLDSQRKKAKGDTDGDR